MIVFNMVGFAAAAGQKFTITPASASISQGSTVTLTVQADTSTDAITKAQACIKIGDSSKLELINTDYSDSPLRLMSNADPATDCAAGAIQLARSNNTSVSGQIILAKLTFKALDASSSVNISFDEAKSFIGSTKPSGSASATISLTAIPAAAPSDSPGSPAATNTALINNRVVTNPGSTASIPAITDAGKREQAVSSDVTSRGFLFTGTPASKAFATQRRIVYILIAALLAALIAVAAMTKFAGIPGLDRRRFATAQPAASSDPEPFDLSRIPDPKLPMPSTVITPEETDDQK